VHREGYNVLYGDGRVKWYADTKKQILWPEWVDAGRFSTGDEANWRSRANNYLNTYYALNRKKWRHRSCSLTEWNRFDMSAGIDLHESVPERNVAP